MRTLKPKKKTCFDPCFFNYFEKQYLNFSTKFIYFFFKVAFYTKVRNRIN